MDREQYIFDDKRRMVRARFYELVKREWKETTPNVQTLYL